MPVQNHQSKGPFALLETHWNHLPQTHSVISRSATCTITKALPLPKSVKQCLITREIRHHHLLAFPEKHRSPGDLVTASVRFVTGTFRGFARVLFLMLESTPESLGMGRCTTKINLLWKMVLSALFRH